VGRGGEDVRPRDDVGKGEGYRCWISCCNGEDLCTSLFFGFGGEESKSGSNGAPKLGADLFAPHNPFFISRTGGEDSMVWLMFLWCSGNLIRAC